MWVVSFYGLGACPDLYPTASLWPIHSYIYPKDEIGVVGMETDSIIYIPFPTFLHYQIHLPWRVDMDINLAEYGRNEIDIT